MNTAKSVNLLLAVVIMGLLGSGLTAVAQDQSTQSLQMPQQEKKPILLSAEEVTWSDGPASMPPGTKMAILEGDPAKPGPVTMRMKLPPNATIAPHTHPADERITVLSGTLYFALGEMADVSKAKALTPGSFFMIPSGDAMFAFTTDQETIIQLNAEGPWGITYLETVG